MSRRRSTKTGGGGCCSEERRVELTRCCPTLEVLKGKTKEDPARRAAKETGGDYLVQYGILYIV